MKIGDVIPIEVLEEYRKSGGGLYFHHLERWYYDDEDEWQEPVEIVYTDEIHCRKAVKVSKMTPNVSLDYNVLFNILNKSNKMKKYTVSRAALKELYDVACRDWRKTIVEIVVHSRLFTDEFEVSGELVKQAWKEAIAEQRALLEKHGLKPESEFNSSMLEVGETMRLDDDYPGYDNLIIIRTYDSFVCLSDVSIVWAANTKLEGTKLPAGTRIEVVSK